MTHTNVGDTVEILDDDDDEDVVAAPVDNADMRQMQMRLKTSMEVEGKASSEEWKKRKSPAIKSITGPWTIQEGVRPQRWLVLIYPCNEVGHDYQPYRSGFWK